LLREAAAGGVSVEGGRTTTVSDDQRFVGWHRPGPRQQWVQVLSADGEASCWRGLLDRVRGGDLLVLPVGRYPWAARQAPTASRPGRECR